MTKPHDIHQLLKRNLRDKLYILQRGRCHYCNRECRMTVHLSPSEKKTKSVPDLFTLDHIYPESKGGRMVEGNAFGACFQCNQEKGDKLKDKPVVKFNSPGTPCKFEDKFKPEVKLDIFISRKLSELRQELLTT